MLNVTLKRVKSSLKMMPMQDVCVCVRAFDAVGKITPHINQYGG